MSRFAVAVLASVVGVAMAASATALTRPSAHARTAICATSSVFVTYDRKMVVVKAGRNGKVLAAATSRTRSVAPSCQRIRRLGTVDRAFLTETAREARLTCGGFPYWGIEVEPARAPSGRIIGTRVAVYRNGGEIVEALLRPGGSWFNYGLICRKA